LLLEASELPGGGLRQSGLRSSRSIRRPFSRHRQLRNVEAVRWFGLEGRGLIIALFVFDSEGDAEKPIRNFRTHFIRHPGVTIVAEREVHDVAVEGIDSPYLWERDVDAGREGPGTARAIAGRVNNVALVVDGSALEHGFTWDEVSTIAGLQASKIRERGETKRAAGG
jgi:hypothetical protein